MNNKDLDDCLDAICHFVSIYKNENKTPHEIYKNSKYGHFYLDVSVEKIAERLKNDRSLIKEWIQYSEDKRHFPSWGISERNGKWVLFYIGNAGRQLYNLTYEDIFIACAHMIRFEMEDLRLIN